MSNDSDSVDWGLWEVHAQWWQDAFTEGADPEYEEQILPLLADLIRGADRLLDVGTGEGQVARLAVSLGVSFVVGIDPARNQISAAIERSGSPAYARAEAAALPFLSNSFDAVVVCLVFEHIASMDEAVAEVGRVLSPGGRFLFLLNHPLFQTPGSGWVDDHILNPPERYWRVGPYLIERNAVEEVQKEIHIPFVHRPLSRYVNALIDAGLVLERMVELAPPSGFVAETTTNGNTAAIPRVLGLVSRRP